MSVITATGKDVILKFNPKKISSIRFYPPDKIDGKPFSKTVFHLHSGSVYEQIFDKDTEAIAKEMYNQIILTWKNARNKSTLSWWHRNEMEWVTIVDDDRRVPTTITFPLSDVETMQYRKREEVMDAEITYIYFNLDNGDVVTKRYQDWKKERLIEFNTYVKKWEQII